MFKDPLAPYYNTPLDHTTARMMLKSRHIKLVDIAPLVNYHPRYLGDMLRGKYPLSDHLRIFLLHYIEEYDQKYYAKSFSP